MCDPLAFNNIPVYSDSIEDARAALELYIKALEFKRGGTFDKVLRDIYDFGRKVDWKLGVNLSSRNLGAS